MAWYLQKFWDRHFNLRVEPSIALAFYPGYISALPPVFLGYSRLQIHLELDKDNVVTEIEVMNLCIISNTKLCRASRILGPGWEPVGYRFSVSVQEAHCSAESNISQGLMIKSWGAAGVFWSRENLNLSGRPPGLGLRTLTLSYK